MKWEKEVSINPYDPNWRRYAAQEKQRGVSVPNNTLKNKGANYISTKDCFNSTDTLTHKTQAAYLRQWNYVFRQLLRQLLKREYFCRPLSYLCPHELFR